MRDTMADPAHEETDRTIAQLERELQALYKETGKAVSAKQRRILEGYYRELQAKKAEYESGDIDRDEYKAWLRRQSSSATARKASREIASDIVRADSKAVAIINGALAGVYAANAAWAQKRLGAQARDMARKAGAVDISTRLIRHDSRAELEAEYLRKAAAAKADKDRYEAYRAVLQRNKDKRWTQGRITAAVTYGMKQGWSNQKMEAALESAMGENYRSCVRYARTYCTGIENLGRLAEALAYEAQGWKVEKEWLSAHDHRTRDSHRNQDQETRGTLERFSDGLMYPGDRSTNDPGEFINCRCRMNVNLLEAPWE